MSLLVEAGWAALLFTWVMIVVSVLSKRLYDLLRSRGVDHVVAVYYNRKFIHVAAGGLVALTVPWLFETPLIPVVLAAILAFLTYLPHRRGQLMYWFQVEDNTYEVHFCVMWGLMIGLSWLLFNSYWYGLVPVLFMAFGDAVTGVVRNMLYARRTKSWWGNLAMAATCIPLGGILLGVAGAVAGLAASLIEHFDLNPVDDNILVPLTAFLVITAFSVAMPWAVTPIV